jgi:hypothetical protein
MTSQTNPLDHLIGRLRTAEVILDPYPHYIVDDVLPRDYYQLLLRHLPDSSAYQNLFAITDLKLDHFRHRDQSELGDAWAETLPVEIRGFWTEFNRWFLGPDLARAVLQTMAEPLRERLGEEHFWPEVSVEAQLIRHRAGYFLGPHSDLFSKLVVLLFYLAPDDSLAHVGTSLYRPRDPSFSCPDSKHYSFDDFVKVKTVPYRPNSVLAFVRSDRSFHGVEPLSERDVAIASRDLIQYVLYDKPVRQEQLRKRRLAAGSSAPTNGSTYE